jgi:hypothetical protein
VSWAWCLFLIKFIGFNAALLICFFVGFPVEFVGFHADLSSCFFVGFPVEFVGFPVEFVGFPVEFVGFRGGAYKGSRAQNTKDTLNLKTQAKPVDNSKIRPEAKEKMSSLRSRHDDWEGCGSPLPNPPRRLAIDGNHGNEWRHSHRKPKDGLQEGTRTVGNHGNGRRQPTQKKPAGERNERNPSRFPPKNRRRGVLAPRESVE